MRKPEDGRESLGLRVAALMGVGRMEKLGFAGQSERM